MIVRRTTSVGSFAASAVGLSLMPPRILLTSNDCAGATAAAASLVVVVVPHAVDVVGHDPLELAVHARRPAVAIGRGHPRRLRGVLAVAHRTLGVQRLVHRLHVQDLGVFDADVGGHARFLRPGDGGQTRQQAEQQGQGEEAHRTGECRGGPEALAECRLSWRERGG